MNSRDHSAQLAASEKRAGTARVPGPGAHSLPAVFLGIWRDRLGLMTRLAEEYGDVVRFKMGPKTLYYFNHPDHAKHILADQHDNYHRGIGLLQARRALGDGLLTTDGAAWRTQRAAVQPVFNRDHTNRYASAIVDETSRMVDRWRTSSTDGPVDLAAEMTTLTLAVLGRTLIPEGIPDRNSLGHAFEAVQDQAMFEMVTLGSVPHWLPTQRNRRFRWARRQIDEIVSEVLGATQTQDGTLVSRLSAAYQNTTDPRQRHRTLRDALATLLLAGHETTSSTLTWAFHLLAERPDVVQRMRAEISDAAGDRPLAPADVRALRYTTMVVQETMRLFPPVWILPRRAVASDRIGGVHIPAGADVIVCPYTLHRHQAFWDRPTDFDPDRFDPQAGHGRHRFAYIPFGAGPRHCVGSNLGMLEATLVAAMVVRDFDLVPAADHPPHPLPMLSLKARDGLPMHLVPHGSGRGTKTSPQA
ncbi:cytochrome P450 [Streptomyces filamentosus]|uniref:cytochrome P450 n=1 Tax=Streptomyces filamentosus TaxID=67294 RepID=UPI0037D0E17A